MKITTNASVVIRTQETSDSARTSDPPTNLTFFSEHGLHRVAQEGQFANQAGLAQRRVSKTISDSGYINTAVQVEDQSLLVKLKKLYINQGRDIYLLQHSGVCFLHYAAERGLINCVKYLLIVCNKEQLLGLVNNGGSNLIHLAAACGHPPILKCAIDRFGPQVLSQRDNLGFTAHHFAAYRGQVACLDLLLNKDTQTLYCKESGGSNPVHWAAFAGQLEVLQLVAARLGSGVFATKGQHDLTALHFAAQGGYLACVDFLLTLDEFHDYPSDLTNSAAISDNVEVMARLVNHYGPEILLDCGTREAVPLEIAATHDCLNMVKYLLKQDIILKNLNRIDPFANLLNLHSQCTPLLVSAYKHTAAAPIPWPSFTAATGRNVVCEWPLMAARPASRIREWPDDRAGTEFSPYLELAQSVLAYLGSAAIYLYNPVYDRDSKDCFFSMGDLVAGSLMAKALERLGAQSLDIILSPPRVRQSDSQKADPEVARYKLAAVWPEIEPATPLPQTIRTRSGQMTFRACDDHSAPLPPVIFSFLDINTLYQHTHRLPENFVCLKPYHFGSQCSHLITNIRDGRGCFLPLSLPTNSVIPEPSPDTGIESANASECVAQYLCRQSLKRAIDLCVIYGLHHSELESGRAQILHKWISSIRLLAEQRKKPTIVAVASRFNPARLAEQWHIKLIDCDAVNNTATLFEELDELLPGQAALCNLTSLPKAHFDQLVRSSNLPTLTEGANLTSFLLQNGHPYLSVLPGGDTPIPQDAGDPLEAMKLDAFSYKLAIDDDESQFLATLHKLVVAEAYEQALKKIDTFAPGGNLNFLQHTAGPCQTTVRTLLVKGGDLGHVGRQALLSAIDPTPEALMRYINSTLNKESATAHHFKLKQRHVNLPHLNAVAHALVTLGRYKAQVS